MIGNCYVIFNFDLVVVVLGKGRGFGVGVVWKDVELFGYGFCLWVFYNLNEVEACR